MSNPRRWAWNGRQSEARQKLTDDGFAQLKTSEDTDPDDTDTDGSEADGHVREARKPRERRKRWIVLALVLAVVVGLLLAKHIVDWAISIASLDIVKLTVSRPPGVAEYQFYIDADVDISGIPAPALIEKMALHLLVDGDSVAQFSTPSLSLMPLINNNIAMRSQPLNFSSLEGFSTLAKAMLEGSAVSMELKGKANLKAFWVVPHRNIDFGKTLSFASFAGLPNVVGTSVDLRTTADEALVVYAGACIKNPTTLIIKDLGQLSFTVYSGDSPALYVSTESGQLDRNSNMPSDAKCKDIGDWGYNHFSVIGHLVQKDLSGVDSLATNFIDGDLPFVVKDAKSTDQLYSVALQSLSIKTHYSRASMNLVTNLDIQNVDVVYAGDRELNLLAHAKVHVDSPLSESTPIDIFEIGLVGDVYHESTGARVGTLTCPPSMIPNGSRRLWGSGALDFRAPLSIALDSNDAETEMTKLGEDALHSKDISLKVKGKASVRFRPGETGPVLKISTLKIDRTFTTKGLNGLTNVSLKSFQAVSGVPCNYSCGLPIRAVSEAWNPSAFSLSGIGFSFSVADGDNVVLGHGSAEGVAIHPGSNTIAVDARVKADDERTQRAVGAIASRYLRDESQPVAVAVTRGDTSSAKWLRSTMEEIRLKVPFPGVGPMYSPVGDLQVGSIDVAITSTNKIVLGGRVQASIQLPPSFQAVVIQELYVDKLESDVIDPVTNRKFGSISLDGKRSSAVVNGNVALVSFSDVPLQISSYPGAESLLQDVLMKPSKTLRVRGLVDATTSIADLGTVPVSRVPFHGHFELTGFDGFKTLAPHILNLSVMGGDWQGIDLSVDVAITNPSKIAVQAGKTILQLMSDNVVIGYATIDELKLPAGPTIAVIKGVHARLYRTKTVAQKEAFGRLASRFIRNVEQPIGVSVTEIAAPDWVKHSIQSVQISAPFPGVGPAYSPVRSVAAISVGLQLSEGSEMSLGGTFQAAVQLPSEFEALNLKSVDVTSFRADLLDPVAGGPIGFLASSRHTGESQFNRNVAVIRLADLKLHVTDAAAAARLVTDALDHSSFDVRVHGVVNATASIEHLGSVKLFNVPFTEALELPGFNSFSDFKPQLQSFALVKVNDDGLYLHAVVALTNPSTFEVQAGSVQLRLYSDGINIGDAQIDNLHIKGGPGTVTVFKDVHARIFVGKKAHSGAIGGLVSRYLSNVTQPIVATIDHLDGPAWVQAGLRQVGVTAPFSGIDEAYSPVGSIAIESIGISLLGGDSVSVSTVLLASVKLPRNFEALELVGLNVSAVTADAVDPASNEVFGSLASLPSTMTTQINNNNVVQISIRQASFLTANSEVGEQVAKDLLTSSGRQMTARGVVSATAYVKYLGPIDLSGAPFSGPLVLPGFHSLSLLKPTIQNFVLAGSNDFGVDVNVGVTVMNPSKFALEIAGCDLNVWSRGFRIGTASLTDVRLSPGPNKVSVVDNIRVRVFSSALNEVVSAYLKNTVQHIQATIISLDAPKWIEDAVMSTEFSADFPGVGPGYSPLQSVMIKELGIDLLGGDNLRAGGVVEAFLHLPDQFNSVVINSLDTATLTVDVIDDSSHEVFASIFFVAKKDFLSVQNNVITVNFAGVPFNITRPDIAGTVVKDAYRLPNKKLHLKGTLISAAAATSVGDLELVDIPYTGAVEIVGFNSFRHAAPKIKSLDLVSINDGSIDLIVSIALTNPSRLALKASSLSVSIWSDGVNLGEADVNDVHLAAGPYSVTTFQGVRARVFTGDKYSWALGRVASNYLRNQEQPLVAKIKSIDAPAWISEAVKSIDITAPFPGVGYGYTPVTKIDIVKLGISFSESGAITASGILDSYIKLPSEFSTVEVYGVEVHYINGYLIDPVSLQTFGALHVSSMKGEVIVTGGVARITLDPTPFEITNMLVAQQVVNDTFSQPSRLVTVRGDVSATAHTNLGPLPVSGVPFYDDVELTGFNSFSTPELAPQIRSFDIAGADDDGIDVSVELAIKNPSQLAVSAGYVSLELVKQGCVIGVASVDEFSIDAGPNVFTVFQGVKAKVAAPEDPGCAAVFRKLLSTYARGQSQKVEVWGSSRSSSFELLKPAFASLRLTSTLPGLKRRVIQKALFKIELHGAHKAGEFNIPVTAVAYNPFSIPIEVGSVRCNVYACVTYDDLHDKCKAYDTVKFGYYAHNLDVVLPPMKSKKVPFNWVTISDPARWGAFQAVMRAVFGTAVFKADCFDTNVLVNDYVVNLAYVQAGIKGGPA